MRLSRHLPRVAIAIAAAMVALLALPLASPSASTALATAQAPAADTPAPAATHTVEPVDLKLTVRRDGRIDSAGRTKIRFAPDSFGGSPKVLEVVHRSGRVAKGDVLVRLDDADLQKTLRSARESLTDSQRTLDLARQERQVLLSANVITLERTESAQRNAQHASETFQKSEGANMIKSAELGVQSQEYSLDDQKEELHQLESMYKGAELASETREIVLERARRGAKMTEQYLGMTRDNFAITKDYRFPDRQLDITQQLRWTAADLEHARTNTRLADIRSLASIENDERAVRDNTERLDKLERDQALFALAAPADGLVTAIELQPGDTVSPNSVICELLDPEELVVKFNAGEEDLRVLTAGKAVKVAFPAFGEVLLHGTIGELSLVGSHADSGATFPCVVSIEGTSDLIRIGERCRVMADTTLKGVLAVPRAAVETREGRTLCKVRRGGATQEVDVVTGAGNETMVQVVSGLAAGDEVVVPGDEGAAAKGAAQK